jgi:hypothetical protein
MSQNVIMHQMEKQYGVVTNQMLRNLIAKALSHARENVWPRPPTRDQRRAKCGLVAWIDDHAAFVMAHIRNRTAETFP